jgi:hypothetical protein
MKSRRARRPLLLRLLPSGSSSSTRFGREPTDTSGRQEVHHRLVAFRYREQLKDLQVSASTRSSFRSLPPHLPEHSLLVSPSVAVAEEMLPGLGYRPAFATALPALVILSESEPVLVPPHWRASGLQSVEPGCQRLLTVHWHGSDVFSFAFQSIAVVLTAFVVLPLSRHRRLFF